MRIVTFTAAIHVLLTLLSSVHTQPAEAGELRRGGGAGCDWRFTGIIGKGDARQFEQIEATTDGVVLCLDSPGGSLVEGQAMFDAIWRSNIFTRVEAGASCLSACALAFMGGSWQVGTDVVRFSRRWIHPGARLGFHRPYLDITGREGSYEASVVAEAFDHAMLSALKIYEMNQTTDRDVTALSDYLYYRILATKGGPTSFHFIETVGDLVMSDIDLQGFDLSRVDRETIIRNICDNVHMRFNFSNREHGTYDSIGNAYASLIERDRDPEYRVEARRDGDGWSAIAGPYRSGTKYYMHGCRVSLLEADLAGERDPRAEQGITVSLFPVHGSLEEGEKEQDLRTLQVPPLYGFRFDARIDALSEARRNPAAQQASLSASRDPGRSTAYASPGSSGRCKVTKGSQTLDDEPCTRIEESDVHEGRGRRIVYFVWPSGGKTVMVHDSGIITLNGSPARLQGAGECAMNSASGNQFCFVPE